MIDKIPYQKLIYIGIVTTALGVTLSTTLEESMKPLGVVLIAIGGLFFIVGMGRKRKETE
jgi:predicted membrane channel-forming protein YqfA (hemolysin III family)